MSTIVDEERLKKAMWRAGIVVLMKRARISSRAILGPETRLELGDLGGHRLPVGQGALEGLARTEQARRGPPRSRHEIASPRSKNPVLFSISDSAPGASATWAGGLVEPQTVLS